MPNQQQQYGGGGGQGQGQGQYQSYPAFRQGGGNAPSLVGGVSGGQFYGSKGGNGGGGGRAYPPGMWVRKERNCCSLREKRMGVMTNGPMDYDEGHILLLPGNYLSFIQRFIIHYHSIFFISGGWQLHHGHFFLHLSQPSFFLSFSYLSHTFFLFPSFWFLPVFYICIWTHFWNLGAVYYIYSTFSLSFSSKSSNFFFWHVVDIHMIWAIIIASSQSLDKIRWGFGFEAIWGGTELDGRTIFCGSDRMRNVVITPIWRER